MKYCISYYQNCPLIKKADEIMIKYTHKTEELLQFIKEYDEDQRIIVNIISLEDIESNIEIFNAAAIAHKKFGIMLSIKQDWTILKENNLPFFFVEGASCLDELDAYIIAGVSDIYIINELGFQLDKVYKVCHRNGIQVRVYPNVAQSKTNFEINGVRKFYIRPDDVSIYEPYVDVFEFFGDLTKQPVYYDIYNDERWLGDLGLVIIGLNTELDNKTIMPVFGEARLDCGKKCVFDKCNICREVVNVAEALKEKNIGIIKKKKNRKEVEYERQLNENDMPNESDEIINNNEELSTKEGI